MSHCTVPDCGAPTSDRLCASHTAELVAALRSIAVGPDDAAGRPTGGLWSDLQDVVCKRVRRSSGASVASNAVEAPLPYDPTASSLADEVANTITTWCREIAEANPHLRCSARTVVEAAVWMAALPSILATHLAADELFDEIVRSVLPRMRRALGQPSDRSVLGECGAWLDQDDREIRLRVALFGEPKRLCDQKLYAWPNMSIITCPACGTSWEVSERREWLRQCADERLATQVELRGMVVVRGEPVKRTTLAMWITRGRLVASAQTSDGVPLFRLGDALDLAVQSMAVA